MKALWRAAMTMPEGGSERCLRPTGGNGDSDLRRSHAHRQGRTGRHTVCLAFADICHHHACALCQRGLPRPFVSAALPCPRSLKRPHAHPQPCLPCSATACPSPQLLRCLAGLFHTPPPALTSTARPPTPAGSTTASPAPRWGASCRACARPRPTPAPRLPLHRTPHTCAEFGGL